MSNWDLIQRALTENIKLKSDSDKRVIWFDKEDKKWKYVNEGSVENVDFDNWFDESSNCELSIYEDKESYVKHLNQIYDRLFNNSLYSNIGKICMVRTYSAGVFYGKLVYKNGKEGIIENARRIYSWEGAATLSQLAMEGTTRPSECKFPCAVSSIELTEIIEVIPMTEKAIKSLNGVAVWEAKK